MLKMQETVPRRKYPQSVICLNLFLYFFGHFGNNRQHRTTALYWFPCYTGFHGITALQCMIENMPSN